MRKNSLTRQVRRAYRQRDLARVCTLREDRFGRAFGMETVRVEPKWKPLRPSDRSEDYYHFRDNNSSVLAVAHLDTVVSQKGRTPHFRDTAKGPYIQSGALDDRLGAYVILSLLPKLGLTCDWLLTVGEESGASTADYFDSQGKKYDHVIEFDRGGTDVVMYQYEDDATCRLVEAAGARVGSGSFSDIAYLEQLGVKAFNWGVGYRGNYHSEDGYAFLDDTFAMVAKYLRFHEQNAGTPLPHEPGLRGKSRDGYYDSWADYYEDCDVCMMKRCVDSVTGYCEECGSCWDCGQKEDDGCMCYVPKHVRDEVTLTGKAPAGQDGDWRQMSWDEYCELRPGREDFDDVLCAECRRHVAKCECAYEDNPGSQVVLLPLEADLRNLDEPATVPAPRISAAPPWSEHRPAVSHGLGFPTGRKGQAAGLSEDLTAAVKAARQADRNMGGETVTTWHNAAEHAGAYVVGHIPGPGWARVCLRCAARWPHPVADSREIHPETDCPGCERCQPPAGARWDGTGAIHVIPAHLAGDSDVCSLCLSEYDRGDRPGLRALDSP